MLGADRTSCRYCEGRGWVVFMDQENDNKDYDIDYDIAACSCPAGRVFRKPFMLRLWCAKSDLHPVRIGRLEEFE